MVGTGGGFPATGAALSARADVAVSGVRGCADLVRDFPWERTSMGPMAHWDPVVRATVDVLLDSPVPMALAYGDEYLLIYNDAYAAVLGG
jgi:hypothetical protein